MQGGNTRSAAIRPLYTYSETSLCPNLHGVIERFLYGKTYPASHFEFSNF